jgi:hypothetical protein
MAGEIIMSNPKTVPSAKKPQTLNGWVRKCELDDYLDRHLPLPTQVVSNEEYIPLPQTREQRAVEHRLLELGALHARKLVMDRRQFFRTTMGMAAGFAALNSVFGKFFRVDAAELFESAAAAEKKTNYFIFDVQDGIVCTTTEVDGDVEFYDLKKQTGFAEPLPVVGNNFPSGADVEYDPLHKLFLVAQPNAGTQQGPSVIYVYNIRGKLVKSLSGFSFSNRFTVIPHAYRDQS